MVCSKDDQCILEYFAARVSDRSGHPRAITAGGQALKITCGLNLTHFATMNPVITGHPIDCANKIIIIRSSSVGNNADNPGKSLKYQ